MIFQDPYASLNCRMPILEIVGEPFITHGVVAGRKELEEKVADLLSMVGLDHEYMRRYPHAFSGGQRQRIAIARALALRPQFIVADEPVSALDVSVQAQILNLLRELQERLNLTYLFIAHNLAVVEYISTRVAVMYMGKIVETASTEELFIDPKHPYTEALLSAIPKPDPKYRKERTILRDGIGDAVSSSYGCSFYPRCKYAVDICKSKEPPLINKSDGEEDAHYVACHLVDDLDLLGIRRRLPSRNSLKKH